MNNEWTPIALEFEVVVRRGGQSADFKPQDICEDFQKCSEAVPSRKAPKRYKNREHGHVLDDEEIVVRERISRNPDYQLTVSRSVSNHNI